MKKTIKCLLVCFFVLLVSYPLKLCALELSAHDVLLLNSISKYLDTKPEKQAVKQLEKALVSENPCVKGTSALILYKHFGSSYRQRFLNSFTLNRKNVSYKREKIKLVKFEHLQKVLDGFKGLLDRLKDERIRNLYLFFHLRNIDLWLLGSSGERLSMAVFYRISSLNSVLDDKQNIEKFLAMSDIIEK